MSEWGSVVALGMFDGLHMGHRALLASTVALAEKLHCQSLVYTFRNHPRSILSVAPPLLMTPKERCDAMLSLGIDHVVMKEFDHSFAKREPEEFLRELVIEYRVRGVAAGYNYTFGYRGSGHGELMERFARENGILCEIIKPVRFQGRSVSSSRVREAIQDGEIELANAMLTAPYTITGRVAAQRRIGTAIGFPTANLELDPEKVLPHEGVYATRVILRGGAYDAVTSVGASPTVGGGATGVETYLLGCDDNLYSKEVKVEFHRFLREIVCFDSAEALKAQISLDASAAMRHFGR